MYDITKRSSFEKIAQWYQEAKDNGNPNMSFILIGNKSDLNSQRQVKFEEGKHFADQNDMIFIETSAKTGASVQEVSSFYLEFSKTRLKYSFQHTKWQHWFNWRKSGNQNWKRVEELPDLIKIEIVKQLSMLNYYTLLKLYFTKFTLY